MHTIACYYISHAPYRVDLESYHVIYCRYANYRHWCATSSNQASIVPLVLEARLDLLILTALISIGDSEKNADSMPDPRDFPRSYYYEIRISETLFADPRSANVSLSRINVRVHENER